MTPAAEALMRAIAEHRTRSPELRLVVEMARAALLAEGVPVESAPPPEADLRSRKAVNQAEYRRRRREAQPGNALPFEAPQPGNALPAVTAGVTGHVAGYAPPDPPETLSEIVDLSPSERESETRVRASAVTGNVTAIVTAPVAAVRALELTEPLTDELREIARFPGCEVQDVEGAWRKFLGHYAGQVIPVAGWWQKWCTNESRRERTQRDKRQREEDAAAPKQDSPAVREERKRREQARRAAEKDAVPPTDEAYAFAGRRPLAKAAPGS